MIQHTRQPRGWLMTVLALSAYHDHQDMRIMHHRSTTLAGLFICSALMMPSTAGAQEVTVRAPRVQVQHAQPMLDPVQAATGAPGWLVEFQTYDQTVRVNASDPQAVPTIGAAIEMAAEHRRNGLSTRIVIAAGTYREVEGAVLLHDLSDPSGKAVIAIEAEQPGTVIISGSEVFADWRPHESMDGIYVHAWDKGWGFQRHWWGKHGVRIDPLGHRRENVWINGERQLQALLERDGQLVRSTDNVPSDKNSNSWMVLAGSPPRRPYSELEPGTFYVDEVNSLLVLRLKPGVDLNQAAVEVSTKAVGMAVNISENIIVRGLTFQHFANTYALARGSEALRWRIRGGSWNGVAFGVHGSRNIVLEDLVSRENNRSGFEVNGANDLTARRINASDNGGSGGGFSGVNLLLEDLVFNRNNWRGYLGNFTGWDGAGIKSTQQDRVTYRNVETCDNFAYGFWFDIHAIDVHIDGLISTGNLYAGAYMEMLGGPVEIVNAKLEDNGMGLLLSGAANVSVKDSRIVGNGTQVTMRNDFRYRPVHFRFENNVIASRADTFRDVVVEGKGVVDGNGDQRIPAFQYWVPDMEGFGVATQPLFMPNASPHANGEPSAWQLFLATLQAKNNTWYHPTLRHAFLDSDRWPIDFAAWTAMTGETGSTWTNPVGDTTDWRQRKDVPGALAKPEVARAPGIRDYTLDHAPVWPEDGTLRINAGARDDWTDAQGRLWLADTHNQNGQLFTGVSATDSSIIRSPLLAQPPEAIAASGLAPIYAAERYQLDGYLIAAPVGSYTVRLHFSENHVPVRAGHRQFAVVINGETAIDRLDVVAEAGGPGRPLVRELRGVRPELFVGEDTGVLNAGRIMIEFKRPAGSGEATMINAIEVIRE